MSSPELPAKLKPSQKLAIGWREWVALPELGVSAIKAKIDTGARTSALHATGIQIRSAGGRDIVDFIAPGVGDPATRRRSALLIDRRSIKNTSGVPQERLIIRTLLSIAGRRWPIEISLTDRMAMSFDLILGRTAVRDHDVLVDPGRSYLCPKPSMRGQSYW